MREEFIDSFSVLDINTKRNQISNELIIIHELIKDVDNKKRIQTRKRGKNYETNKDVSLTEG